MKRHNGWDVELFGYIFMIIIAVICLVIGGFLTKLILESDLPDWLKFLLLK